MTAKQVELPAAIKAKAILQKTQQKSLERVSPLLGKCNCQPSSSYTSDFANVLSHPDKGKASQGDAKRSKD